MPRCKECKEKFDAKYFNQKHCLEKDECIKAFNEYVKEEKKKQYLKQQKKDNQELEEKINSWKPEVNLKKNKKALQDSINKLSRMIDIKFGYKTCIDCDKGYGPQTDAAHFHGIGSNHSNKYNLHNLHSANSGCNQFSDKHKEGYKIGLTKRYGSDYLEQVEGLILKYPKIKLSSVEIVEKLKLVRRLIRTFDTYTFQNPIQSREILNKLIGIYN